MTLFEHLAALLIRLDKKHFEWTLVTIISTIGIFAAGATVFIFMQHQSARAYLAEMQRLSIENRELLATAEHLREEEERIQNLLNENKNFNIKSFFEQFCQEEGVTPDPNWETETIALADNNTFEEVKLSASFQKQTTEKLVSMLSRLDKHPLVYIKSLEITPQQPNFISVSLELATEKHKSSWDA